MIKEQLHLYLVPTLSIFLTYIIGRLSNTKTLKQEALKERYNNFYIPYMLLLIRSAPNLPKIITTPEIAMTYGKFIIEKAHYLEKETVKYSIKYYLLELDYFEFYDGNPNFIDAENQINALLIEVSLEILKEATKVAKALKLSPISETLYDYLSNYQ